MAASTCLHSHAWNGQNSGLRLDISNIIKEQKWESAWLILCKVVKAPVKYQWYDKLRWSVHTEEFKCTLSKFQRYVEWKTDIVISACLKNEKMALTAAHLQLHIPPRF